MLSLYLKMQFFLFLSGCELLVSIVDVDLILLSPEKVILNTVYPFKLCMLCSRCLLLSIFSLCSRKLQSGQNERRLLQS